MEVMTLLFGLSFNGIDFSRQLPQISLQLQIQKNSKHLCGHKPAVSIISSTCKERSCSIAKLLHRCAAVCGSCRASCLTAAPTGAQLRRDLFYNIVNGLTNSPLRISRCAPAAARTHLAGHGEDFAPLIDASDAVISEPLFSVASTTTTPATSR